MILSYLFEHWDRVLGLAGEHLQLSLTAVAAALVIALPLGAAAARYPGLRLTAFGVLSGVYTIPSLALLALLIPPFGLGKLPATIALSAYSLLFLTRNIAIGLQTVDSAAIEAGLATGMTPWQLFWGVRLPLALPAMIAGVRIALVTTISLASVAAWVNAGGLGTLLFDGITRDNLPMIAAGTVAVATLALAADQVMRLIEAQTPAVRARRAASARS